MTQISDEHTKANAVSQLFHAQFICICPAISPKMRSVSYRKHDHIE